MDENIEENKSYAKGFLRKHNTGVLCTTDEANLAYGSVIYFDVDENFKITFTTKDKTRKSENIKNNNQIMLVVFDVEEQTTVQISGVADEINDDSKTKEVLNMTLHASLASSGNSIAPVAKLNAGEFIAYSITVKKIRMASFDNAELSDYNERFITIDF